MSTVFLQTTAALDSDLTFMPGTPLVMSLVEWTRRGLGNVDVLKASEDAQPRRTVIVGEHRPQTMPTVTLLELEHHAQVHLIPARLLGASGIKCLVPHPNHSASVNGQVYVGLATALGEYSV